MTALLEVVDGLAARLDTIDGLRVYDHVPGSAFFPAAFIMPPTTPFWDDLGDGGSYTAFFEVPILVGAALAENQRTLIPFIDPQSATSVYQAIKNDRTLGGLDVDALATAAPRRLTFDEIAAYKAWGMVVMIQVMIG